MKSRDRAWKNEMPHSGWIPTRRDEGPNKSAGKAAGREQDMQVAHMARMK